MTHLVVVTLAEAGCRRHVVSSTSYLHKTISQDRVELLSQPSAMSISTGMKAVAGTTVLLFTPLLIASQSLATENGKAHQKLSKEQKQELFIARRAWEIKSHDRRIAILQEAQRCIKAANNPKDYRICEKAEGEARRSLRAEALATMNQARKSVGLPPKAQKGN